MSANLANGGRYTIRSLVEEPNLPPVGITDHGLDFAPVRLNQSDQIWTITPRPTQGLQFSIGRFPYTAVDREERNAVCATLDSSKDVTWFATFTESQDAFIITEDVERTKGWTVEGANASDALIVVNPITVLRKEDGPVYLNSQLFKIEPADD